MSIRRTLICVLLVVATACSRDDRRGPPPPPATPPALAHATQADLGRELDDADKRGTWSEVRKRWEGQLLRWTVTRQRLLCGAAEACNVAAFPISRPAPHGWMPLLAFAPGEYAKLDAACGTREQCTWTFEGTLAALDLSGDQATKLRFANVRVVDVAAERGQTARR